MRRHTGVGVRLSGQHPRGAEQYASEVLQLPVRRA